MQQLLEKGYVTAKMLKFLISENDYSIFILVVHFGQVQNSRLVVIFLQNFEALSYCLFAFCVAAVKSKVVQILDK